MRAIFFFAILFATTVRADEPVKIPLKDIWAYNIPGTTEISEKELPPKDATPAQLMQFDRTSLVRQTYIELGVRKPGQLADEGFCVAGEGLDALKAAHAVLVKHEKPPRKFEPETEITLVFFAHSTGKYLYILDAERGGTTIRVQYRFKAHMQAYSTTHFALIPLGKLVPGQYSVEFVQKPIVSDEPPDHPQVGKLESDEWVNRIICKPFSFLVKEK
jgi:hypothetical protein